MEIFYFLILLISVLGNIFSYYLLYNLLKNNVSGPKQLYNKRKDNLVPFVVPMKDADQRDLSEVDDEVLKASIKNTISNGIPEYIDDEEKTITEKEFMA